MKYGVTAATGKFGKTAVETLLEQVAPTDIVAIVRNPKKAKQVLPAGIEIRQGDYTELEQLEQAFSGIDRLLFISSLPSGGYPRDKQHLNVVAAAKKAKITYIAYTSFPHADQATSVLSADHRTTEKALQESGLQYSFLRNNWYLENQADLIHTAQAGKPVYFSAGDGQVGWAPEKYYAQAAAKVLQISQPKRIYEFAGKPHTFSELAQIAAETKGKQAEIHQVNDDQYREILNQAGLQAAAGAIIMIQQLIRQGELTEDTSDLTDVLGQSLPELNEAIKEI
ncbi:hypothetical protein FC89_GL000807 [Liquorilactobacillus ghanensis DSM 18630]|uniref:NAD(P)-binding domain-containing protein n=1 Tax=Liquorilactobacillus ghanensis DSM 18630 TaxID=1423750 RepID=A0A0R1VK59_9LACO|nr:NAD(P)H-binding protein [Liquorilactobacillus ghanensis]KRM05943.1 hypothetical protein FC89_GL000807 [Liquorilactobacillus ghanensis DSM 18630]